MAEYIFSLKFYDWLKRDEFLCSGDIMCVVVFLCLLFQGACTKTDRILNKEVKQIDNPANGGCDSDSSSLSLKLKWKAQFVETRIASSIIPVVTENAVVVTRSSDMDPPNEVIAFDKVTGNQLWIWSDYRENDPGYLLGKITKHYLYNNMLVLPTSKGIYAIDISTGATLWSKPVTGGEHVLYGADHFVFHSQNEVSRIRAFKYDLLTNEECELVSFPNTPEVNSNLRSPFPIDGNVLIANAVYHFIERYDSLALYSYPYDCAESNKMNWDFVVPSGNHLGALAFHRPVIYNNSVVLSGISVRCLNLDDGSLKWINNDYGVGGFGLVRAGDKIIGGTEGSNPKVYALNADNGQLLWEQDYGGNAHEAQYHDCRVYAVSGGDGLLYVFNANTGQLELKMESPDREDDDRLFFDNCRVDTSANLLYAMNYRYLICYEIQDE